MYGLTSACNFMSRLLAVNALIACHALNHQFNAADVIKASPEEGLLYGDLTLGHRYSDRSPPGKTVSHDRLLSPKPPLKEFSVPIVVLR